MLSTDCFVPSNDAGATFSLFFPTPMMGDEYYYGKQELRSDIRTGRWYQNNRTGNGAQRSRQQRAERYGVQLTSHI